MADRTPFISWPGVLQPVSCRYTLSQGVSPGNATLEFLPQDASQIALQGDLILGDGVGLVRLKNCKVAYLRTSLDPVSGHTWTLEILDRRWRWLATGFVAGAYNVADESRDTTRPPEGTGPYVTLPRHYVSWTVRTPHDLIRICLDAMGERNYRIDAPNIAYPLPAIAWDYDNPAQVLARLCESLGCRVVYRPDADAVWIVRIGTGAELPEGGPGVLYRDSPGMAAPARPDSILLVGAPIKYDTEWALEAVGEEWDGRLKPIESLSYAPEPDPQRHRIILTPSALAAADVLTVTFQFLGAEYSCAYTMTGTTVAEATAGLTAVINGPFSVMGFRATDNTTSLTVEGPSTGERYGVKTTVTGSGKLAWELTAQGGMPKTRWAGDNPYSFCLGRGADDWEGNADLQRRTNRLTYAEAVAKANKSVFRYYRLANVNVETGFAPAVVPGYGELPLSGGIYRVVLLNEQLDQVIPEQADAQVLGKDLRPITRDYYDGLFRQKPARCFGRYHQVQSGLLRQPPIDSANTEAHQEVLVDFTLVPERALIVFAEPVFLWDVTHGHRPADIRLRCAAHLRDPRTNALVRYTRIFVFPGPKLGTKPAVIRHDDVEYLVKGYYTSQGSDLLDTTTTSLNLVLDNSQRAHQVADYYITAAALRYQTPRSGERQYNGIVPVMIDGAILQVTWSISVSLGAETVASRNAEHAIYAPMHPERVRTEYLRSKLVESPDPTPRGRNMMEGINGWTGKPKGGST
jgi:hypothetical protein